MKEEEFIDVVKEKFGEEISREMKDAGMESPIERMLYGALQYHIATNPDVNSPSDAIKIGYLTYHYGLQIFPQFEIGPYRVDFLIKWCDTLYKEENGIDRIFIQNTSPGLIDRLVVECDGHDGHERSEEDRRREKKRDRELMIAGYRVFHYTGKEITDDPFGVASEIISNVTNILVD